MSRARGWVARLVNMFRRERQERELDAELRAHLALHIDENVRQGMSPPEARRVALARLGGMESVKEQCRDVRRVAVIDALWHDLRYGARMLRKAPGFAAAAILTLALGIGATTAIFSVVNGVLLKPLPFEDQDELVGVWNTIQTYGGGYGLCRAQYFTFRDESRVFEDIGLWSEYQVPVTGLAEPGRESTRVAGSLLAYV